MGVIHTDMSRKEYLQSAELRDKKIRQWIAVEYHAGRLLMGHDGFLRAKRDVSIVNPRVWKDEIIEGAA